MGVNTNLAAGARAVHANRGAGSKYDVGAAFGKSLGKAMESISTRAEAHERDRRAIGAKVEKWGSKLDDSISTKHVPEAYQQDVAKFAARSRDEYWQFAQMASKSDAGSSAYIEAVTGMNQINSSMKNLKNELVKFAEGGTTFAADNKSKHLSAGNNNVDLNQLSDVYSQSMPLTIGADGSLAFDQEDGSSISLDQLPEYHKKDFAGAQDFLKKVNTIHKAGRPLDVTLTGMYESELTNMLEAGGRARMLDFAVGNTVTVGGLGIQNPHDMPDEELLAAVRSGMMNVLVESANNGAKERTGRSNKGSGSLNDQGSTPTSGPIKMSEVPALADYDAVLAAAESGNADVAPGKFVGMNINGNKITNAVWDPATKEIVLTYNVGPKGKEEEKYKSITNFRPREFGKFVIENIPFTNTKVGRQNVLDVEEWIKAKTTDTSTTGGASRFN